MVVPSPMVAVRPLVKFWLAVTDGAAGRVVSIVLDVVPAVNVRVISTAVLVNEPSTKLPAAQVTSPLSPGAGM